MERDGAWNRSGGSEVTGVGRLLFGLLVLALSATSLSAQAPHEPAPTELDRATLRGRWNALDEEERALYRERFAKLAEMRGEERLQLEERAAELEQQIRELRDELPPDLQRRLRMLGSEKRNEIVREFFCERQRSRGVHVREQLPAELVEELETAPPAERPGILRRFHDDMRRRAVTRLLEDLPPESGVASEELERIESLAGRERMRAVLELERVQIRRRVEAHGPPPDLGETTWQELDRLPLEGFFRAWRDRRRSHRELGPGGPLGGIRAVQPPAPGPWTHRGHLLDRLIELSRPSLEDLIDLAQLSERERRAGAEARARERCETFLDDYPFLPPGERSRLEELPDGEFLVEVRVFAARQLASARGRIDGLRERQHGEPSPGAPGRERR